MSGPVHTHWWIDGEFLLNGCMLCADRAASPEPTPGLRPAWSVVEEAIQRALEADDASELDVLAVNLARGELDAALAASPAPEPTGLDAALFREMAQRMHDALIPLDSQPLHPAVTWNVCTDPMCQAARRALNGTDTGETGW